MNPAGETGTVVVGYDGSDGARRGLARAERLASDSVTIVVVVVVPDVRSPALGQPLVDPMIDARQLLDEARQLLSAYQQALVETREAVGDPAAVLVDVARERGADLVVIGRRGADFVTRTLLGSVAERVVQHATCDVLVVA